MDTKSKILVVDDIEMNRAMLMKIFANDYEVLSAENGLLAMEEMQKHEIDLVLLDLSMPEMDGYEVITAMKSDQKLASIPIVVTTGAIDKSERRAFDLGADDFITKPYDPYIVRKRVENLIRKYVLQVENLKQALGQAEQLNKAKSAFLSRMSHDLRSPLNSVISIANLIVDHRQEPDKVTELSRKIEDSSKYLLGVINDILNVSAIENQKIVITRSPFNFRKQMESIAAMFYGQCKEKQIDFKLNLTDFTEEFLFGDPMRLKEILINLISNAVKFTPAGGSITVRISQISRVASMLKLRFEVIDTGEGIEVDCQEKIFRAFTQENNDTVQKHGGSGLGLSIVKSVTELMGGTVSVRSKKGEGSIFTVELPFTVSKELPEISTDKLKDVRALLIDDDKETQEYATKLMAKLGIICDIANTGEEALAIMKAAFQESRGYDICFVDWRMPGMSGIDITRAIRATFDDDTIIVVASAYNVEEITQDAKMAGANVVVPKPMFQSTVFDLLMNLTGGAYVESEDQSTENYHFAGKRILIAEDNTLNAQVAEELLQLVGFQTERAVNGKIALDKFRVSVDGTYDAILMDIQMPIMTGIEATKEIRKSSHPQAGTIPIIALTANAFTDDVIETRAAGMNEHLAKPIDTERLYEVLDKYVGQTK